MSRYIEQAKDQIEAGRCRNKRHMEQGVKTPEREYAYKKAGRNKKAKIHRSGQIKI